jgi:phosphoribosyl 1,2-cyclic phosphodiesterase
MSTSSVFTVCSLFSGSKGNCTYVRAGETEILIDAGVSAGAICRSLRQLGTDLSHISAILITHEHSDHIKGLEVVCKKYAPAVHLTETSALRITAGAHLQKCIVPHADPHFSLTLGELSVRAFPVPHDSACCVGYRLETDSHAVAIATDIGKVTKEILEAFLGAEGVIVESNHDIDMLLRNPHYPPALKERILSGCGHLSNDFASRFLAYLAESGTRHALLAHLSKENNTPELALSTLQSKLHAPLSAAVAAEAAVTRLI